jgi:hypothetical protein
MSSPLPEKGTAKYYEAVADEPSDFIDDGPEEGKVAAKAAKKAADGKVAVQAADGKVAVQAAPTQKEIDDFMARMTTEDKDRVLAAYTPVKKRAPKGAHKTKCDEALKNIKPTIKYIFDNHKDEHLDLYLLGLYVKDFESRLPFDSAEHDAFKHWLTDNKLTIGLKKQTRKSVTPAASPAGSKNVSRAPSVALDISFENDEEAGAGAGSGSD